MGSWLRVAIISGALASACTPATEPLSDAPQPAPVAASAPAAKASDANAPAPIVIARLEDLPAVPADGVGVEGWGPVRIGMTLDQLNAALGAKLSVADDLDYKEYSCTYLYPVGAPKGLSLMFSDGEVVRIDIDDPGVATYGGLQVGDTSQRARELFGGSLNAQPHFYVGRPAEYLTLWTAGGPMPVFVAPPTPAEIEVYDTARGVRFETSAEGVIERFYAGSGAIERVEGCL